MLGFFLSYLSQNKAMIYYLTISGDAKEYQGFWSELETAEMAGEMALTKGAYSYYINSEDLL